ncbi:MAG: response regulator [Candidatus Rokubacteria bacterium]|nr:response regulator [Candidatus Rokubacteria bacterium]
MSHDAQRGGAVRVGLVGAGRAGTALLEFLATAPTVRVVAVADPNPEAPGLARARARGIPVLGSHQEIFAYDPQIVIELTGRAEVLQELSHTKPVDVEVVGAQSARFFWDMLMLRGREVRQLEKAETMRRLAEGPFHGLKNLITILQGRSQLLLRSIESGRAAPAELTKGLRIIAEQTASLGANLKQILNRLRGFMQESADEPVRRVDVNDLVRKVLAFTEPLILEAEARVAAIEVRQMLSDVAPVLGRPSELSEVLVNLIVNAIEAMPQGGVLTVETAHEQGNVFIQVKDTGVGMPETVKAQLFTPFFTTKAGGTGLGLNIAREIIGRHGGELAVESVEGTGSCFTIQLAAVELSPTLLGEPRGERAPWRALVVDDDVLVREFLAEVLTSLGWLVTDAADGREALAKLMAQSYDLVLADIILPEVAGWEVARAALAQEPPPAVILLSGWIEPDDPALKQSGADAFLHKPVPVPDLVETVREVMARRPPAR